jgi:hypothetical protein
VLLLHVINLQGEIAYKKNITMLPFVLSCFPERHRGLSKRRLKLPFVYVLWHEKAAFPQEGG